MKSNHMLTYCWDQTRFFSLFLTHFYGFIFSFFAVRCWLWPSSTFSWGLWSQPAPDFACPKLSRCFVRFLRASCVWEWPSAIRFLTHSHQSVFFCASDLVLCFIAFDLLTSDIYFPSVSHTCLSAARRPCPCARYARSWTGNLLIFTTRVGMWGD